MPDIGRRGVIHILITTNTKGRKREEKAMRLWSAQALDVYELIKDRGVYRMDPEKASCYEDFREAYDWLVREMERKVGKRPDGVLYPVWAYAVYDGKSREPDLYSLGGPGEEFILFELEIPDDRLVLTEYDTWHYVLNKWFYCRVKDEEDFRSRNDWFDALPPEEKEKVMERSWQAVFDTELRDNGEWDRNGRFVQATFWELRTEDIVSCRRCVVPEEEEEE